MYVLFYSYCKVKSKLGGRCSVRVSKLCVQVLLSISRDLFLFFYFFYFLLLFFCFGEEMAECASLSKIASRMPLETLFLLISICVCNIVICIVLFSGIFWCHIVPYLLKKIFQYMLFSSLNTFQNCDKQWCCVFSNFVKCHLDLTAVVNFFF